jgi:hypothetical protein
MKHCLYVGSEMKYILRIIRWCLNVCVAGYTCCSDISCLKYIFDSIAGNISGTRRYGDSCNWCHISASVAELSFWEKGDGKESVDQPELILQIQEIELLCSDTHQAVNGTHFYFVCDCQIFQGIGRAVFVGMLQCFFPHSG